MSGLKMPRIKSYTLFALHILFISFKVDLAVARDGTSGSNRSTVSPVNIGVVLDLESPFGAMAELCMSMAHSDFYSLHSDYRTRLALHTKHADNVLDTASAVLGLLKNEEVHGIVGLQDLADAAFAAKLGEKAHVPIISFTPSPLQVPYFVHAALDGSYQAKALSAICHGFQWYEVVVLYEDTDDGNKFVSLLNEPFQESEIQLCYLASLSPSAEDSRIEKELMKLREMRSRVFLVHVNAALGARLFYLAEKVEMMSDGYAWIVTDSLSSFLGSMNSSVINTMEGVLGVRPYVPESRSLQQFRARWERNILDMELESIIMGLNVYGLWVYDTIWALAMAAEKAGEINLSFSRPNNTSNGTDISNLGVSEFGPKLLKEFLRTEFEGVSGDFRISEGKLQLSALEIINIVGTGDRRVGYWKPEAGLVQKLETEGAIGNPRYSTSTQALKKIIWPGDTFHQPTWWAPKRGKLRVGVPKKYGYTEFVKVEKDPVTNEPKVSGFSTDVFIHALKLVPLELDYEFVPFMNESGQSNGSYNDMLRKILDKTFDIVVGDTTILADRASNVDFALPYSESGVVMVVKNKKHINMWIFIDPLRWDLWVTIVAACIFIGVALKILEHHQLNAQAEPVRLEEPLGFHFWFPIAVLAFPERNIVANNWSRFVLVLWLFMAFVLMQSYTAKLSAIFTVDQLKFAFYEDINVGVQDGSFVKELLIDRLHFNSSKIKQFSTIEEYHDAMTLGSKNGGIDAICDEIPYMKLLLRRYGNRYRMVGPTYRTDGFGFAFPRGSLLVPYFSRAILNVTQGPIMTQIEEQNFGPENLTGNEDSSISQESPSLTAYNFGGLFIIVGSGTLLALFCSVSSLGQRFCRKVTDYSNWCFSSRPFHRTATRVHSIERKEDLVNELEDAADGSSKDDDMEGAEQGNQVDVQADDESDKSDNEP